MQGLVECALDFRFDLALRKGFITKQVQVSPFGDGCLLSVQPSVCQRIIQQLALPPGLFALPLRLVALRMCRHQHPRARFAEPRL